jgi:glucan biosynthesis protein C
VLPDPNAEPRGVCVVDPDQESEESVTNERTTRRRLFFIDNLRTVLIILVVLWHMAITYGASGYWPYREVGQPDDLTALVFTLFGAVNGPFVLAFFYMIAGYFTPRSYDRRGPVSFFKGRLLRLGIPLLFYIIVFDPLIYYAISINVWGFGGSLWEYLGRHFKGYHGLGVGPLWFAEALLIFGIIYGLWRLVAGAAPDPPQRDGQPPGNLAIAAFALAVGVVTFVMRIWLPVGWIYRPLGLPLSLFPQYIALFAVGLVAYRRNWLLGIPQAMGKLWVGTAAIFIVVLLPTVFVLGGALEGNDAAFMGGLHWQSFAYAVWEQFVCVGMVLGLLVWFRRRWDHQGPLARAMSASTYTVYFIHAPVLVFLALALRGISLYPLVKFALVAPVAVFLCFFIGHYLRKLPLARNIL